MFKSLLKALRPEGGPAAALEEARRELAAGNACEDAGRLDDARGHYVRATTLAPHWAEGHLNLGIVDEQRGDRAAARACYEKVLELDPAHAFGAYNLGKLLYVQGELPQAEALLRSAVAAKPELANGWVVLSNVLDALGKLEGAKEALDRALALTPDFDGALFNLAGILRRLGRIDEAEAAAGRAAALAPGTHEYHVLHATMLVTQGFADEALEAMRRAVQLAPHLLDLRSRELFLQNLVEETDSRALSERHLALGAELEAAVPARARTTHGPKPRLRIGYVSSDLCVHPVALFLLPVLEGRSRQRFEVFCYSSTRQADHVTERVKAASDHWLDVSAWTDHQLADAIASDRIDILVDLNGHTGEARLATFAEKPAAVQFTWLGYLNTTGLRRMDFRLTDARCDPLQDSQPLHSEALVHLPPGQWCYRPFITVEAARTSPALRNGYVTLGSLNSAKKLTPQMAVRWGRILKSLPSARLVVADIVSERKKRALLSGIEEGGGDAARVRFAPRLDLAAYYRLVDEIDIALDSYPYGGGTTTFDALWTGVPVVTAPGSLPCSRSAASILQSLGLDAWVAPAIGSYESVAVARAGKLEELVRLRASLRERLRRSPLMDEAGFVRSYEQALEAMARQAA